MQTIHTSTSHTHIHAELSHAWTKHCPQYKDIKINRDEKRTKKEEVEKKEGGDVKYVSLTKSLNRP